MMPIAQRCPGRCAARWGNEVYRESGRFDLGRWQEGPQINGHKDELTRPGFILDKATKDQGRVPQLFGRVGCFGH